MSASTSYISKKEKHKPHVIESEANISDDIDISIGKYSVKGILTNYSGSLQKSIATKLNIAIPTYRIYKPVKL